MLNQDDSGKKIKEDKAVVIKEYSQKLKNKLYSIRLMPVQQLFSIPNGEVIRTSPFS